MSKKSLKVLVDQTTVKIKVWQRTCHIKKLPVVVVVFRGQLEALGARVLLHEAKELPCVLTAQLVRYSLTLKIIKKKNGKQR